MVCFLLWKNQNHRSNFRQRILQLFDRKLKLIGHKFLNDYAQIKSSGHKFLLQHACNKYNTVLLLKKNYYVELQFKLHIDCIVFILSIAFSFVKNKNPRFFKIQAPHFLSH